MGLRDDMLSADILRVVDFPVERLNRTLRLKELNGDGRDRITSLYVRSSVRGEGVTDIPPRVHETYIVLSVVDESGKRVFEDKDVDLIAEKWPGDVIKEIADKVAELSGMGLDAGDDAAKNSESAGNSDSGSDSPLRSDTL